MYLGEIFHVWRRRPILTAILIAAIFAGSAVALAKLPRTYQSNSSVVLLASRSAAGQNGGNPFLNFSPSLTLTADVLSRELMAPDITRSLTARGFTDAYTVALPPYTTSTTGSVLVVTVTGHDNSSVEGTLRAVTAQISTELSTLQDHVARRDRIRVAMISFSPRATLSANGIARQLAIVVAPGLLIALGFPVFVDRRITRRRSRREALLAEEDETEPTDGDPSELAEPGDPGYPGDPGQDAYDLPELSTSSFELTHPYGDWRR
jgi:hypothetical protein